MSSPDTRPNGYPSEYSRFIPSLGDNPSKDKLLHDGITGSFCILFADTLGMRPLLPVERSNFNNLIAQAGRRRPNRDDENFRSSFFVSAIWFSAATRALRMESFQRLLDMHTDGEQVWTKVVLGTADIPRMIKNSDIYNPVDVKKKMENLAEFASNTWHERYEPDYTPEAQIMRARAILPVWWDNTSTSMSGLCDHEVRFDVSLSSAKRFNESIRNFASMILHK